MPKNISFRAREVQASPIRKLAPLADEAAQRGISIYYLNIGQPDIPTPPAYWKEVQARQPTVLAYGPSSGLPELREEISQYYKRDGISIDAEQVLITTGASEGLVLAMIAVADPGEEIICFEPFYTNFASFAAQAVVRMRPVTTSAKNGFHLPDSAEIEKRITKKTRAILICSPNNPTGTILGREEIERLAKIVLKHDLFLITDETYRDIIFDGHEHVSTLEFPEMAGHAIVVDSISKRFSACGARLGNIVTRNPDVISCLIKFAQARLCPPTMAQYGAAAIYRTCGSDYFHEQARTYQRRRDVLHDCLCDQPGVFFLKPEGAFYAEIQIPVDDSDRFAAWMLTDFSDNKETTVVAPGAGFYITPGLGKNEIRIAFVIEENKLVRALDILKKGLRAYPGRTL